MGKVEMRCLMVKQLHGKRKSDMLKVKTRYLRSTIPIKKNQIWDLWVRRFDPMTCIATGQNYRRRTNTWNVRRAAENGQNMLNLRYTGLLSETNSKFGRYDTNRFGPDVIQLEVLP